VNVQLFLASGFSYSIPPEVTAILDLQPSNMFMESIGTVQACVMIVPSGVTETSLTVDLRSLDGSASE